MVHGYIFNSEHVFKINCTDKICTLHTFLDTSVDSNGDMIYHFDYAMCVNFFA